MKRTMNKIALSAVALMWATLSSHAQNLSPDELARRATERRAVDAAIWGMPAVNYDLMLQQMLTKTSGKVNQVIYWGQPLDWKNQTLTPNPDTLYFMAFLNTKDVGPIVIDVPPAGADGSLNANIVLFNSTIRYDESFFEGLNRIVQSEPWLHRDRVMIDQLKSIGIEKDKPFAPNAPTKQALAAGIRETQMLLEAKYDAGLPPFFEGTHWTYPTLPELIQAATADFEEPNAFPLDARALTYSYAYIGIKRLGAGQFYLISIKDKDGQSYDGAKTYRLTVPPNAPVEQYWSVTAYDRQTHALIKNVDRASRASNVAEVKKNQDGSVDIFFGPKAPAGKESNWVPTDPARKFELMFRLYAPTKALFEKTWKLPDVEKVAVQ